MSGSINFRTQLGAAITELPDASPIIKQMIEGLDNLARGNQQAGFALLSNASGHRHDPNYVYTPSGKHAYIYTEILALTDRARMKTRIPNGGLSWMRDMDEDLYDLLVNVNHPVQPVTCAGVVSHHLTEKAARRAIHEPMIDLAESALKLANT